MEDERLLLGERARPRADGGRRHGRRRASTSCASTRAGATIAPAPADTAPARLRRRATPTSRATTGPNSTPRSSCVRAHGHADRAHRDRPRPAAGRAARRGAATRATSPTRARSARSPVRSRRRYGADVDRYLIWNEPNQPGWLRAAARRAAARARKRCTPRRSAPLPRPAGRAPARRSRRADPGRRDRRRRARARSAATRCRRARPIAPLTFLRALACVDERYRRMPRRGACRASRPPAADAIGHHPHGVKQAPDEPVAEPDVGEDRRPAAPRGHARPADRTRRLAAARPRAGASTCT